ncbi:MAG TPA: PIG-L family deacetylase [Terriglobales bacterium]|nr:PIG-L family deacetylase [Terriglobales bacterium]
MADPLHLIIAAHIDDDGVGMGIRVRQLKDVRIVYLTDSAPRDPRFFNSECSSRQEYAARRRLEAERAAAWMGIAREQLHFLEAVDMEAFRELARLESELQRIAAAWPPATIWSPAYDGGHPDHDVAAFLAARLAARTGARHWQFALYRFRKRLEPGQFAAGDPGLVRYLNSEERELKRQLFQLYRSQAQLLTHFDHGYERHRPALAHDFRTRPTKQPTLYEAWRWPVTAEMLLAAFAAIDKFS